MLSRRSLLQKCALGGAALLAKARAELQRMKITRIRYYHSPFRWKMPNQSSHILTVETDQGITGIGEGGTPDGIEQLAGRLIGQDPTRIEYLWQLMYRGSFYPPGRELIHALGAYDLALWDIKAKALGIPVYEMLGGLTREHVECYATAFPSQGSLRETARACIEAGFRAFREDGAEPPKGERYVSNRMVRATYEECKEMAEGVKPDGDWAVDYHTRFDFPDAVRLSTLLEPLEPLFCEDLVRSENPGVYRELRQQVKVPIAVGEHFGDRWEINELIEGRLIDYSRVTLPNAGGITELKKQAALCETHYVGLVPHFTGPVAEAALVHVCASFPGPAFMEMLGDGSGELPHLPECYDFKNGKMWPNQRPGLGVTLDASRLRMFHDITEPSGSVTKFERPDGSLTNW